MADIFNYPPNQHHPHGRSRRLVLIAGIISLLIAVVLSFLWKDLIFSHLHFEPAKTEILEISLHGPYSAYNIYPAPTTKSMPGGIVLHLEE